MVLWFCGCFVLTCVVCYDCVFACGFAVCFGFEFSLMVYVALVALAVVLCICWFVLCLTFCYWFMVLSLVVMLVCFGIWLVLCCFAE